MIYFQNTVQYDLYHLRKKTFEVTFYLYNYSGLQNRSLIFDSILTVESIQLSDSLIFDTRLNPGSLVYLLAQLK